MWMIYLLLSDYLVYEIPNTPKTGVYLNSFEVKIFFATQCTSTIS